MYKNDSKTCVKYYSEYLDKIGKKHYTVNVYKHFDKTVEKQSDLKFQKVN